MAKIGFSGGSEEEKKTGTGSSGNTGTGNSSGGSGKTESAKSESSSGSSSTSGGGAIVRGDISDIKDYLSKRYPTGSSTETQISNEERAETSLAELKNDYSKMLQDQYNYSAEKLKAEKDAALRENWILQQQAEAALPEQLAAGGINGGATETSLAALRAQYQGNRNDIQSGYADNLGELEQERIRETAQNEKDYNDRWLEYLLTLAEAEKTAKYS